MEMLLIRVRNEEQYKHLREYMRLNNKTVPPERLLAQINRHMDKSYDWWDIVLMLDPRGYRYWQSYETAKKYAKIITAKEYMEYRSPLL